MCAKYATADGITILEKAYDVDLPPIVSVQPRIIYPHVEAPVLVAGSEGGSKFELKEMNYSLIPSWSKVRKPKFVTYNARIEEVLVRPSWREAFQSRHCLVPMASFQESVYEGRFAGHSISITSKDKGLLTAAGIWESWWDSENKKWIQSFAILTQEPSADILEAGHDRSPIFLKPESFTEWTHGKASGSQWVEFLKSARQGLEFDFIQGERLKSFTGQLSFFGSSAD